MNLPRENIVYTIGHSTHSSVSFPAILDNFGIITLIDIRRFPGSRKFPHFNQQNLEISLPDINIRYLCIENLGGLRKIRKDSINSCWRHASFRGYVDYMETDKFKEAISLLTSVASESPTAYMCAEMLWWRCHRALISDYLKAKGWTVLYITAPHKTEEHPSTSPACVNDEHVS